MSRNRYQNLNNFVSETEAAAIRTRAARNREPFSIIDPVMDASWARLHTDSDAPKQYFDYYFGPQDIKVHIAELGDDPKFGDLPIYNLGFNVEQEKAPIYGFWSYTFDGVMRGTRLVSGSFTLITKHPNYMRDLLAAAAKARADAGRNPVDDYPRPGSWRSDDANIEKYWSRHIDPSAQVQRSEGVGTEWSSHPPFSLVILYGVQNTSVETQDVHNRYNPYTGDNALLSDHNQRLVEGFNGDPTRIILDSCELKSASRIFSPDQQVVAEQYEFFARDIFVPRA